MTHDNTLRCGHPEEFTIAGRWEKRALRWFLMRGHPTLDLRSQRLALGAAFAAWQALTNLTITEAHGDPAAEILLGFFAGDHKDGQPFDGPRGVIAHAYLPSPARDYLHEGDVHFDADEQWSLDLAAAIPQVDLQTVALHEIGHALGLGHSADPTAVMAPRYQGARRTPAPDDVAAIQAIYGVRSAEPPPALPPAEPGDLISRVTALEAWRRVFQQHQHGPAVT